MSDADAILRQPQTWLRLGLGGLLLAMALVFIGRLVTGDPALAWLRAADASNASTLAADRTATLDGASQVGSQLSDTLTCIVLSVAAVIVMRWITGRWREGVIVATAILGELMFFLLVTATVPRDRPAVVHLDPAPPTSSFPSGHTAAAFALYMSIAVVALAWGGTRALPLIAIGVAVPFIVAISRMYRGMHFLSDVLMGVIGGGLWLALVITVIAPLPPPGGRPT